MNRRFFGLKSLSDLKGLMGSKTGSKKNDGSRRKEAASEMEPATLSESRGVRYLHLGTPWIQGAMRRSKPLAIELEYVRRMMSWMLLVPTEMLGTADAEQRIIEPAQGHAVQLGLGAAAITKFCHQVLGMQTTAIELNPTVIDACRMWFTLPEDDDLLTVLQMDAGLYVADPTRRDSVQVLTVDLYDHDAASPVLDDEGFYRNCRGVLAPGGVMSVNLFGRDASFEVSARHIESAFGVGNVWSLPPNKDGNTIVLAGRDVSWPDEATLAQRAKAIDARFGWPAAIWARMLQQLPLLPGVVSDILREDQSDAPALASSASRANSRASSRTRSPRSTASRERP